VLTGHAEKKKPIFYIVDLVGLINVYIDPKYME
jgi:hypothetical protein